MAKVPLSYIQQLISDEVDAIRGIPADNPFVECVELFLRARSMGGKIVVSGVGKAGEIGKKITTTFCSVGVPSVFLHPLEAQHGDLGVLQAADVLFLISNSGKTREILELMVLARHIHPGIAIILLSGNRTGDLARGAAYVLWNGNPKEVCPLGLAPTTSTTTMAVIGDILAALIVTMSKYSAAEYALRHHSGYLGEKSKASAASLHQAHGGPQELRAIYELLHKTNDDYRQNNWLIDDLAYLAALRAKSVLELGCGNARFMRAMSTHCESITAIDWVETPLISDEPLPSNARLIVSDVTLCDFPEAELAVSADFLEHISPNEIEPLLRKMHKACPIQFHTIACYMDSRNLHLTTRSPDWWLSQFQNIQSDYRILRSINRRGRSDQVVISIGRGVPDMPTVHKD